MTKAALFNGRASGINQRRSRPCPCKCPIGTDQEIRMPATHQYRPTLRPASTFSLPRDVRWVYIALPWDSKRNDLPRCTTRYGAIATDRALTAQEREHFALQLL